jgi:hypothetical protein
MRMRTRIPMVTLSAGVLLGAFGSLTQAATPAQTTQAPQVRDGSHDFDWLYGKWKLHSRALVKRLAGSHEWAEFEATDASQPLPGGLGSEEVYSTDHDGGLVGMTLNLYDPASGKWSLYWYDNRNAPGSIGAPEVGSFKDGIGVFEGPDTLGGKPITVRFTWTVLGAGKARWEQAYSMDSGKTWETNTIVDFTRTD